jgi:selenoprotein W-related protein
MPYHLNNLFLATLSTNSHLLAMEEQTNQLKIEYCAKCRFMMRAAWVAQELLQTFDEILHQVTLAPSKEAGIFKLTLNNNLIWNRNIDGNIPDIKTIKQRIRDQLIPEKNLGHSDTPENQSL